MRPSWDEIYCNIAREVSRMGTCARRQVGAVMVDEQNRQLSFGINGVPPRWPHCRSFVPSGSLIDPDARPCEGATARSGADLDKCLANHAEQNALLQCPDVARIRTVYCTCSPCIDCVKKLLCTPAVRIVFIETYPHPEARGLWLHRPNDLVPRRTWEQFDPRLGRATSTHQISEQ